VLWIVASLGFHLYLTIAAGANPVIGAFGGGVIVMTWTYLLCLALLLGGEFNALLERRGRRRGLGTRQPATVRPPLGELTAAGIRQSALPAAVPPRPSGGTLWEAAVQRKTRHRLRPCTALMTVATGLARRTAPQRTASARRIVRPQPGWSRRISASPVSSSTRLRALGIR
jgi:hypothetical protein